MNMTLSEMTCYKKIKKKLWSDDLYLTKLAVLNLNKLLVKSLYTQGKFDIKTHLLIK